MASEKRHWRHAGPDVPQPRNCAYCRWCEVRPLPNHPTLKRGLGCVHPQVLHGQAGEFVSCCCFEREPGADDDLGTDDPLHASWRGD